MVTETRKFFREILQKNLPIDTFLNGDFTIINERLAKHYGIPNIKGDHFQRVSLPKDHPRRGLLGQASVLMTTSMDTRTAPVIRGAYILTQILGEDPPLPPANVPDLSETPDTKDGKPLSAGEKLRLHREDPNCKSCHLRIDPLGLALENFDGVGLWRDRARIPDEKGVIQEGLPIQIDDAFPATGEKFTSLKQFKNQLYTYGKEKLPQTLVENLYTYALGRPIELADKQDIDTILEQADKQGNGLQTILRLVITSPTFQTK